MAWPTQLLRRFNKMKLFVRRQLSVALPNQPGVLWRICENLSNQRINIDSISVLDTVEQGVVRMLTSDPARARISLEEAGYFVLEADLLEVEVANRAGVLAKISQVLAEAGLNIDYAYGTESATTEKMRLCIKVAEPQRAAELLEEITIE